MVASIWWGRLVLCTDPRHIYTVQEFVENSTSQDTTLLLFVTVYWRDNLYSAIEQHDGSLPLYVAQVINPYESGFSELALDCCSC